MAKINSKAKGNRGELECVKILTERFGKGFARVPSSGAWGGGQNREKREDMSIEQKLTLVSDIMTPPNFKYILEHKNYAEISFWDLFNKSSILNDWTQQVCSDAEFVGKIPMLIMKFNQHKRIVMIQDLRFLKSVFTWIDSNDRKWDCVYFEELLILDDKWWFD